MISCPIVGQRRDPFSSIPSIPIAVPYLASFLLKLGVEVQCIDAFGLKPGKVTPYLSRFVLRGLTPQEIVAKIDIDTNLIGISVHSGDCHTVTLDIVRLCKERFTKAAVMVGGHQATHLYRDFIDAGADFVVLGEGEPAIEGLIGYFRGEKKLEDIDGLAYGDRYQPHRRKVSYINNYPFPSFDLMPLENYWKLGFAHGPTRKRLKYLPLITSRGCSFSCNFCASSSFWLKQWQGRDPESVINEIRYYIDKFKVNCFHIQDPNFATSKKRILEFTHLIQQEELQIDWCLPSGIKLDSLDKVSLSAMKRSGCSYFNFSPEHASRHILDQMNKPVDLELMVDLINYADRIGLKKGACFIIGYYGETRSDIVELKKYVRRLIKAGLDEVSYYIFCPVPGSSDFNNRIIEGFKHYEGLCWSPRWRKDYKDLSSTRTQLYLDFLVQKTLRFPGRMVKSLLNFLSGNYELKSEMTLAKYFKFK